MPCGNNTLPPPTTHPPACTGTEAALKGTVCTETPGPASYCLPSDQATHICFCMMGASKNEWECDKAPWTVP
jgi:hypothetical protein